MIRSAFVEFLYVVAIISLLAVCLSPLILALLWAGGYIGFEVAIILIVLTTSLLWGEA